MRWKISAVLLHHRPDYPPPLPPRPVRATQLPFSPVRVGEPQVRSLRVVLIGLVFHIRSCIIKERFAQSVTLSSWHLGTSEGARLIHCDRLNHEHFNMELSAI